MTPLHLRDRLRVLPAGDVIVHGAVFLLGLAFIGLGVVAAVLPGPFTIPPVLLGLFIWSLEFDFAERWLDKAKAQAQDAWEAARAKPWRTGVLAVVSIGLLVAAVLAVGHYDLLDRVKDAVT